MIEIAHTTGTTAPGGQRGDDNRDVQRGVPLVQLAAVHAAEAEGFALDEVLEVEGLTAKQWSTAEVAWKATFVRDSHALDRYHVILGGEEDRLGRSVSPCDDDLDAWVRLLRVTTERTDSSTIMEALGLGLNDLSRLGRRWRVQLDQEPRLAKKAKQLAARLDRDWQKTGAPTAVPAISIGESKLTPSSSAIPMADRARQTPRAKASIDATTWADNFGLDRYALLRTKLRHKDESQQAMVLGRFGLSVEQATAIDEVWRARLDGDSQLSADFEVLSKMYARDDSSAGRVRSSSSPGAPQSERLEPVPLSIRSMPDSSEVDETTAEGFMAIIEEALPFAGSVDSVDKVAESMADVSSTSGVDGTGFVDSSMLALDAVPFSERATESVLEPLQQPDSVAPPERDAVDSTGLAFAPLPDETAPSALPFAGSNAAPPSSVASPDDPAPLPGGTSALDVGAPEEALSLRQQLTLEQYAGLSAEMAATPQQHQAILERYKIADDIALMKMMSAWSMYFRTHQDEEAQWRAVVAAKREALASGREVASVSTNPRDDAGPVAAETAAIDTGSAEEAASIRARLTLEQYAALSAEMAARPHQHAAILRRFEIDSDATLMKLMASWATHFRNNPDDEHAWRDAVATHRDELSAPSSVGPPPPSRVPTDEPAANSVGETGFIDRGLLEVEALPFHARVLAWADARDDGPVSSSSPRLTVEQYASLRAELDARPHERDAVLGRYNVADTAVLAELAAAWEQHFRVYPADEVRWRQAMIEYKAWLEQRR